MLFLRYEMHASTRTRNNPSFYLILFVLVNYERYTRGREEWQDEFQFWFMLKKNTLFDFIGICRRRLTLRNGSNIPAGRWMNKQMTVAKWVPAQSKSYSPDKFRYINKILDFDLHTMHF